MSREFGQFRKVAKAHRQHVTSPLDYSPTDHFRGFLVRRRHDLLLYAALGGTLFFLPFALIQVGGYSAVLAGVAFLPFPIVIGLLSRWSGGLVDRIGARLPLIIGPLITALGFCALASPHRPR